MATKQQIIQMINDSPLDEHEAGEIMGALLKKTLADTLIGAGMDILLGLHESAEKDK